MTIAPSKVFLDTAFVYALINTRDEWHGRAVEWEARLAAESQPLLTTQFVLMEIGDGLASLRFGTQAAQIIRILSSSAMVEVVPAADPALRRFGRFTSSDSPGSERHSQTPGDASRSGTRISPSVPGSLWGPPSAGDLHKTGNNS